MRHALVPSLLAFCVTALAVAFSAQAQSSPVRFGAPLDCASAPPKSATPTLALTSAPSFVVSSKAESWAAVAMGRVGFASALPTKPAARAAALQAITLIMNGNIVAAKMANDEASATVSGYKQGPFASGFENFLTASTQPVEEATYPSSVRAKDEEAQPHAPGTFGVDLERASASLMDVIRRAGVSKNAMGSAYNQPAVRFYLLAHGFRDDVALKSATVSVCALGLSEDVRKKLDTSARFMAMPAVRASEDVGSEAKK